MSDQKNNNFSDYASIPEDAVKLHSPFKFGEEKKAVLEALRILMKERSLNYGIRLIDDHNDQLSKIKINNFSIKILTSGIYSDEVNIKKNQIYGKHSPTQLFLLAQIDDEYDYVFFKGVLTADEFSELVPEKFDDDNLCSLNVDEFKGGINRFITFIQILNPAFIKSFNQENRVQVFPLISKKIGYISAALTAGIAIIIGTNQTSTLKIASIKPQQVALVYTLRGKQVEFNKSICIISPEIKNTSKKLVNISEIGTNKPLLFITSPSQSLSIIKNGSKVWETKNISEPISWPIEGIQKGEDIVLRIKPIDVQIGLETRIKLLPSEKSFIDLDSILDEVKKNNEWIRKFNKYVETDKSLALSILFSDQASKNQKIIDARTKLIKNTQCK